MEFEIPLVSKLDKPAYDSTHSPDGEENERLAKNPTLQSVSSFDGAK